MFILSEKHINVSHLNRKLSEAHFFVSTRKGEDPEGAVAPLGRAHPIAQLDVGCIETEHADNTEDDDNSTFNRTTYKPMRYRQIGKTNKLDAFNHVLLN